MLILNFSNKCCVFPKSSSVFLKWTKKMSKIENPKYFWDKFCLYIKNQEYVDIKV